eukprot:11515673-Karenia_brevis.AAC.1
MGLHDIRTLSTQLIEFQLFVMAFYHGIDDVMFRDMVSACGNVEIIIDEKGGVNYGISTRLMMKKN